MCWPLKVYGKAAVFGVVFLALLAGACATTAAKKSQQLEEAWQGKSVKELLARKGPPDAKLDDGQGGQIFAYSAYERESDSDAGPKPRRFSGTGVRRGLRPQWLRRRAGLGWPGRPLRFRRFLPPRLLTDLPRPRALLDKPRRLHLPGYLSAGRPLAVLPAWARQESPTPQVKFFGGFADFNGFWVF